MPDDMLMDDWDSFVGNDGPEQFSQPDATATPAESCVPLGYDKGVFYYFSTGNRQVVALTAGAHTKAGLMSIASSVYYWQDKFPGKTGPRWDDAVDWMMTTCRVLGIFDPDRLRGRGAWIDNGRSVLHAGDRLIVDGESCSLQLPGSKYVYEAARSIGKIDAPPLTNVEAHQLVRICQSLRWEVGISGMLMAGFMAVAPVCGGLAWRPSCWLTGGSGSGKTWVNENIVNQILAGIAVQVQSKTSEAGIRQLLGSDARPVIFDEAEREDAASAARLQGVLDLVRQASSETGGAIVKGSQNQSGARSYRIRSSFWFSSINVGIEHQADDSRITVLALRPAPPVKTPSDMAKFIALNENVQRLITPAFSAALLARSVKLLPVIRHNAEIFARAVSLHLGSRRLGDQIGTLLAGAYSLHSEKQITMADAEEFVTKQDWHGATTSSDAVERDELRLLTHLTQTRVRFTPGNGAPIEVTIARLISAAWGEDERISADQATSELREMGIKPDAMHGVFVSNTHPRLKGMLQGTPWASGWFRALLRIAGAEMAPKAVRFTPMHVAKAVYLPRQTLEGGA